MAQAEAFETDFWKDANLRKVWDDIVDIGQLELGHLGFPAA